MQYAQQMFLAGDRRERRLLTAAVWGLLLVTASLELAAAEPLKPASVESAQLILKTRKRVETSKGSGDYRGG
ncbi:MAG: hypothetical protein CMJ75_13785 [Planctomycetaceae bacterium]|nr:hypothetical protein [Planctomycetaceae bacterium]